MQGLVVRCVHGLLELGLQPSFDLKSGVGLVSRLASQASGLVVRCGHGLLKLGLRPSFSLNELGRSGAGTCLSDFWSCSSVRARSSEA